jgi:hypothetical protein
MTPSANDIQAAKDKMTKYRDADGQLQESKLPPDYSRLAISNATAFDKDDLFESADDVRDYFRWVAGEYDLRTEYTDICAEIVIAMKWHCRYFYAIQCESGALIEGSECCGDYHISAQEAAECIGDCNAIVYEDRDGEPIEWDHNPTTGEWKQASCVR